MSQEKKSCSVTNWRADGLPTDVQFLLDRLREYDTVIHEEGYFTVLMDEKVASLIRRNHMKCLLRNDYLQQNRFLRGSKLDKFIDRFLDSSIQVAKKVLAGDSDLGSARHIDIIGRV